MPNTKTIKLTGSETKVRFDANYPYFWAINLGDGDVYMSTSPNIVPDADGVILIPAGEGRSTGDVGQANTLYLLGSGKVEISPQHNAVCPFFKPAGKGGENGGTTNYDELGNKPTVGGATVEGNKTLFDYGLPEIVSDRTADSPENGIPTVGFVNAAVGGMASVIGSETDLNKLINSGTYVINGDLPQNFSGGYPWGILQVLNCAGNIVQIYYPNTNQGYSYRTKWFDTAAWKPWINT